jgi:hypothetical protein
MTLIAVGVVLVVLKSGFQAGKLSWIEVVGLTVMTIRTDPTGSGVTGSRSFLIVHKLIVAPGVQAVAVCIESIIGVISRDNWGEGSCTIIVAACLVNIVATETPVLHARFKRAIKIVDPVGVVCLRHGRTVKGPAFAVAGVAHVRIGQILTVEKDFECRVTQMASIAIQGVRSLCSIQGMGIMARIVGRIAIPLVNV